MSFLTAGFLIAGITLLIPLWLHRRRTAPVDARPVASLLLLRQSDLPVRARQALQDRFLLVLRLLLLALLVLAFAQPVLKNFQPVADESASAPVLVVVDVSASMMASLEPARAQARSLLQPGGTLVGAAADLTVLSSADDDRQVQLAALSSLQATSTPLEFGGLPARLSALADALAAPGTRMPIHLISDFQASGIPRRFNALVDELKHPLILHPVGTADPPNWWIEALSRNELTIRSANAGASEVDIRVEEDGVLIYEGQHSIAAAGETVVPIPASAAAEDTVRILARLSPPAEDVMAMDNVRYHVSRGSTNRQIGVSGDAYQQRYIATALRSSGAGRVVPQSSGELLVVADPGQAPADLADHVRDGGAALVFAGRRSGKALVDMIPGVDTVDTLLLPDVARLSIEDSAHTLTAALAGGQGVRVFDYLPTTVSSGVVLARLDNGDPWLIDLPWGAGRLLLVTTDLDPANSNFAASPQFVGFLSAAVKLLADEFDTTAVTAGTSLRLPARSSQIVDDSGTRLLDLAQSQGRALFTVSQPGFYQLLRPQRVSSADGTTVSSRRQDFAVNPARSESDLTRLSEAELQRWQEAVDQPADSGAVINDQQQDERSALSLAGTLLFMTLLLLLAEALRANGRPGSGRVRGAEHG